MRLAFLRPHHATGIEVPTGFLVAIREPIGELSD
jgi:hypothetical protein